MAIQDEMYKAIEKEIMQSDIGINPTNDGKVIRLVFPELTEERRKELVKDVKKKGEAAKVAIRLVRFIKICFRCVALPIRCRCSI